MHRYIILICFLAAPYLIAASAAHAQIPKPENIDQTLDLMLDQLLADFPDAAINTDAQNINLDADGQMVMNPDNLHAVLRTIDDAVAREAELERFVATTVTSLTQAPVTDQVLLEQVYPVLRHERFITAGQGGTANAVMPYAQPFLGDMVLVYAIDYPSHVASVTQAHLDTSQLSEIRLKEKADLNLSRLLENIQIHQQNSAFMVVVDGFYESSTILDRTLWTDISRQLEDDVVMVVPARDLVLFTPASNTEGVDFLAEARDNILVNGTHQLSSLMYIWRDEGWQIFAQ